MTQAGTRKPGAGGNRGPVMLVTGAKARERLACQIQTPESPGLVEDG